MHQGGDEQLAILAVGLDQYYEYLVSCYWHPLKLFASRHVRCLQDAEDIVQEAFLRAYLALERYPLRQRQTLKARPWLYKIAWNICCNYATRTKQPPQISLSAPSEDDGLLLEFEDDRNDPPEAAFEQLECRQELEHLVAALPQHYGNVVSLYYFDELNYQEIADVLNQPVGTVKVYVHRGVRLLRKALEAQASKVG